VTDVALTNVVRHDITAAMCI